MLFDTLKPVSFPLITSKSNDENKKSLFSIKMIIKTLIVFVFLLIFIFEEDINLIKIIFIPLYVIFLLLSRTKHIEKTTPNVLYLKSKNRIRFDTEGISVKINDDNLIYELNDMSAIKIYFEGYAREDIEDEIFTDTGLNNRIVFTYKDETLNYQFYLDNKTWVILFDKILFKWSWNGIEVEIFHKGTKTHKLPIED